MIYTFMVGLFDQAAQAADTFSGGLRFTVTLGDLISIATTIIAVVAAYNRLSERLAILETKVGPLWETYMRGPGDRRR